MPIMFGENYQATVLDKYPLGKVDLKYLDKHGFGGFSALNFDDDLFVNRPDICAKSMIEVVPVICYDPGTNDLLYRGSVRVVYLEETIVGSMTSDEEAFKMDSKAFKTLVLYGFSESVCTLIESLEVYDESGEISESMWCFDPGIVANSFRSLESHVCVDKNELRDCCSRVLSSGDLFVLRVFVEPGYKNGQWGSDVFCCVYIGDTDFHVLELEPIFQGPISKVFLSLVDEVQHVIVVFNNAYAPSIVVEAFAIARTMSVNSSYASKGKCGCKYGQLKFMTTSARIRILFLSTYCRMKNDGNASLCGPESVWNVYVDLGKIMGREFNNRVEVLEDIVQLNEKFVNAFKGGGVLRHGCLNMHSSWSGVVFLNMDYNIAAVNRSSGLQSEDGVQSWISKEFRSSRVVQPIIIQLTDNYEVDATVMSSVSSRLSEQNPVLVADDDSVGNPLLIPSVVYKHKVVLLVFFK